MFEPLTPALAVAAMGDVPYSSQYGDIYHSSQDALGQARHVFLHGNGLPQRWQGRDRFTVCETGFGLGVNFLTLWQAWREDSERCARLHMVSIEAHPFEAGPLLDWLRRRLPDALQPLATQLAEQWPPLLPGLHRLEFESAAVTLTLAFGTAQAMLPRLQLAADAFFLDGFAPQRNPEMWSDAVMAQLADMGAAGATAATWATAGAMRRGLRAAGFVVEKRPGFGPKREMTVATLPTAGARAIKACASARRAGKAIVIGAGLAGAGVARALADRGWDVWAVESGLPDTVGTGPGHLAAALTPMVDVEDSVRARLARAGALRAAVRWQDITELPAGDPAARWRAWQASGPQDHPLCVARVGTVQVAKARLAGRPDALAAWQEGIEALRFPNEWVRLVDTQEASRLAGQTVGRGGLYFPGGLLVRPQTLCASLLGHPAIHRVTQIVRELQPLQAAGWQVVCASGSVMQADVVVLAAAGGTPALLEASGLAWPLGRTMQHVAGQITLIPSKAVSRGGPECIVAGEGYVLPPVTGWCVAGSTYDHAACPLHAAPVSMAGHAGNLERARTLLPALLAHGQTPGLAGWGGWRAVLRDRMPAIGELAGAPGIWLASGYASRGITWSALAGEVIGASLAGEPAVLEQDLAQAISPQRS